MHASAASDGQRCQNESKWLNLAILSHFGQSCRNNAFSTWKSTVFVWKTRKNRQKWRFSHPEGDTSGQKLIFPGQNDRPGHQFSGPGCMGWHKIGIVFSTFLMPCICTDMTISENGPSKRASQICQKRVENPPERRGLAVIFTDFSEKSDKTGHFPGSECVVLTKLVKMSQFWSKWSK